jgi:hypothetical protein
MPVDLKKQDVGPRSNRGQHFDVAVTSLAPVISELRLAGICNIRQLASCLNDRSLQAPSGGPFSYATTRRVLRRLRELHLGPGPRTLGQAARQRAPRPYQYRAGKPMTLSNSSALKKALAQYGGE